MKVILLIALIYANGEAVTLGSAFPNRGACEAMLATLPQKVADRNTTKPMKIASFAAACVGEKTAKQGAGT